MKSDIFEFEAGPGCARAARQPQEDPDAFNTREAVSRILETTASNIAFYSGGSPHNVVNESALTF